MNLTKQLAIALILTGVLISCKRQDTPEVVTEKFMNHLVAGEFAEARALGTETTGQMLEMFETLESLGGEKTPEEVPTISNIECIVDGDTAICTFEEGGQASELNLVRVDGKWLVDMKKENPYEEMDSEPLSDSIPLPL